VWQHVFAPNTAGNRLPQLEGLSLWWTEPRLDLGDIEHIARCCPNLRAFTLQGAKKESLPLLTGLTKLHTTEVHDDVDDDEVDFVHALVKQLSGLRDLELESKSCTSQVLLELTGLQQLTRLKFQCRPL
jgi:hypothetical protein